MRRDRFFGRSDASDIQLDHPCVSRSHLRVDEHAGTSRDDPTQHMPPRPVDGPPTAQERLAKLPPSIGRYRLIDTFGWGGMGVVYRAEQDRPRRTVAIKVLRHECADPTRMHCVDERRGTSWLG